MIKIILSSLFTVLSLFSLVLAPIPANAQTTTIKKIDLTVNNFSPAPINSKTYGEMDLSLSVINSDIKPGSNCVLEYQPFGHYNRNNIAFQVLDTKPYNATTGCTLLFPKTLQKTLAYNFKFRATAIDGKPYTQVGNNLGYAFKLGSMPVIVVRP